MVTPRPRIAIISIMRVVIAGGSGFIGRRLARRLADRGDHVVVLTRNPDRPADPGITWAPCTDGPLDADAVINLTGENLFARRWSAAQKEIMRSSRVDLTRDLVARFAHEPRPKVLIQASAIGFYGDRGDEELVESSGPGPSGAFLVDTCKDWEAAGAEAESHGVRTVLLRIGVVLGPDGGAIKAMLPPFRFFAGGPVGSGRQWMSWIHGDDLVDLILHAMDKDDVRGAVNGTSPNPVTMKRFCQALGRSIGRPSWLPVPGFAIRLMLGEVAEVLLGSQRVLPERADASGFRSRFQDIDAALADLMGKGR